MSKQSYHWLGMGALFAAGIALSIGAYADPNKSKPSTVNLPDSQDRYESDTLAGLGFDSYPGQTLVGDWPHPSKDKQKVVSKEVKDQKKTVSKETRPQQGKKAHPTESSAMKASPEKNDQAKSSAHD